ncbi:SlyX family protein [Rhizobacter sp. LjRoot28]|jgi:SlyX protein|uniref:SlyX family protein n=1 Tax=Rhizobacter sp. LjRoot28 TaxID=3342309 RepID=UPI003ECCE112
MIDSHHPDPAEQRLTDLEIKASYTEDLVDTLNAIVARQQQQIDQLARELAALRQQMPAPDAGNFRSLRDELPPHY